MTQLVQVALAEDIAEAEELQTILNQAGIASELELAPFAAARALSAAARAASADLLRIRSS